MVFFAVSISVLLSKKRIIYMFQCEKLALVSTTNRNDLKWHIHITNFWLLII